MIKGGPKIINDGLVLCLDAHDAKSYAGEPVTNLYGDISTSSSLRPYRTEYNTSGTWTTDMPMCPENVGRVYKHTSGALTSSWSNNSYGYMLKDIATTSGETYIMTCWVYISVDCDIDYCPAVIEQEASGESAVSGYPAGYDLNNKGTWQLLAKKCVADDQVRFIPLYPRHAGVTDGSFSGFFAWGGAQVVKASYVTPYVLSSRTATNGWVDRSGNSNSGTLTNMIGTEVSHYRDGQVIMPVANSYLDFDGSNDYVDCGSSPITSNSIFSWEAWIYPSTTGTPFFLGTNSTSQAMVSYWDSANNKVRVGIWGSDKLTSSTAISGGWGHTCWTWDGTTLRAYTNGVADGTATGFSFNIASNYMMVGSAPAAQRFGGKIGAVKLYNKVLTAAEVLSNYNATKGRFS